MFIHPLFQGTDEGTELDKFALALGFESDFVLLDIDTLSEKQRHDFQYDSEAFLESWRPEGPAGYTLAATFETDNDSIAFFIQPKTGFAARLARLSTEELLRNSPCSSSNWLTRQITSHHVETDTALRIFATAQVSEGGGCNRYVVGLVNDDVMDQCLAVVDFQHGHPLITGRNGVTIEALLAICMDRLLAFQSGPYPSHYNKSAIVHLERALESLKDRTRERLSVAKKPEAVA